VGPIDDRPRLSGLECLSVVEVTIRTAILLALTAKVEVSRQRVSKRPAAIVSEECFDCLSFGVRDIRGGIDARQRRTA
jgi:hypothetical protein